MATIAIDAHSYRGNQKCQYNGVSVKHGHLVVRKTQTPLNFPTTPGTPTCCRCLAYTKIDSETYCDFFGKVQNTETLQMTPD